MNGTSISSIRDTLRIHALRNFLSTQVYSISNSSNVGIDNEYHMAGKFGDKAVEELKHKLHGRKLSCIFGDYFRFPSNYYRVAYKSFLERMLPRLVSCGLVDEETRIIIPKLNPKLNELPGGASMYDVLKKPNSNYKYALSYIKNAIENPLFEATNDLSVVPHLNSSNRDEISKDTWDKNYKFLTIRIDYK